MSAPLLSALFLIAGLIGLVISAHYFVGGSASLARHWGMRPGLIGLTIVAFGTSAPEIIVSADAALNGAPALGVGNAIGSNIANIGLVLGLTALIARLPVNHSFLRLEIPILLFATALAMVFLIDHILTPAEGYVLAACALAFPLVLIAASKRQSAMHNTPNMQPTEPTIDTLAENEVPNISFRKSILWLTCGLIALLYSANILVSAATDLAVYFGVSSLIIGLTVVALGTSLPELAASVSSAIKGHHEMAIGNILGSNILNIFAVMSLPAIINSQPLSAEIFNRDAIVMGMLTVILTGLIVLKLKYRPNSANLGAPSGLLFLAIYAAYYWVIFSRL